MTTSDQTESAKALIALAPNDDMVMHLNIEDTGGVDDPSGHIDVRLRGRGISGRMVVRHALQYSMALIVMQ